MGAMARPAAAAAAPLVSHRVECACAEVVIMLAQAAVEVCSFWMQVCADVQAMMSSHMLSPVQQVSLKVSAPLLLPWLEA